MKNNSFKKFKIVKVISVLLCFVLILTANFTALAGSLTATEFEKKLQEVKKLYPQGTQQEEWKVNGSVVGWSCHGYARWISHYVWGVDFANGNGTELSSIERIEKDRIKYTSVLENKLFIRGDSVDMYEMIMKEVGSRAILTSTTLKNAAIVASPINNNMYIVIDIYK